MLTATVMASVVGVALVTGVLPGGQEKMTLPRGEEISILRLPADPDDGKPALGDVRSLFREQGLVMDKVTGKDATVPAILLTTMPARYSSVPPGPSRKSLFIRITLPLMLTVNAEIRQRRARLEKLQDQIASGTALSGPDREWLHRLLVRYDLRPDDKTPDSLDPKQISFVKVMRRVDEIPVSLALAQGAVESGWGVSRFARDGNALFGQWTWDPSSGLVPRRRDEGKTHLVRHYEELLDGVRAYALNLNRNPAYAEFRQIRETARQAGRTASSRELAAGLTRYSELGWPYVVEIRKMIRHNRLTRFDGTRLRSAGPGEDAVRMACAEDKACPQTGKSRPD